MSAPAVALPLAEFEIEYVRSSGPGGQNVNKTSTKVQLRWNVRATSALPDDVKARFLARFASRVTTAGDVLVTSDRYRDQPRNEADCVARLDAMLQQVAAPPKKRRPTRPGLGARERRLASKKTRAALKSSRARVHHD